jgi:hypothetical protein
MNFQENEKISNIKIIKIFLMYDDSSNTLILRSHINEKKLEDKTIATFGGNQISTDPSFWSRLGSQQSLDKTIRSHDEPFIGSRPIDETIRNYNELFISRNYYYHQYYHPLLCANSDSSLVLLTAESGSFLSTNERTLYLLDTRNHEIKNITSFKPVVNFIFSKVPFETNANEYRYYDVQNEVKWINDTTFALGTQDGLNLYSVQDLSTRKTLSDKSYFSNFYIHDNSIIAYNRSGIMQIDIESGKTAELVDKSNIFHLRYSKGNIYYVIKWKLFCFNLKDKSNQLIYNANSDIKSYWLTANNHIILRIGSLNDIKEDNQFISYNLETSQSTEIDLSESMLYDYYVSDDSKFFVIHKRTIQLKYYDVFLVYDILNQQKYEFDYKTL